MPSAFAQFRLDLGIDVPLVIGITSVSNTELVDEDVTEFLTSHILPFPEVGAHYFFNAGPVRLGLGARGYTFILESVLWPNAVIEYEISRLVLEGQFGGGAFLFFGLMNTTKTGALCFPDLSAWFKVGDTFRLGGGFLGVAGSELGFEGVPFVFYLGGKAAINF